MIARFSREVYKVDITKASDNKLKKLIGYEKVSSWAKQSVVWCSDNDIIGGIDNGDGIYLLAPNDSAWRASMAKIMTVAVRDVLKR